VYRNVELEKKEAYRDYLFLPSDVTSGNKAILVDDTLI
jgi:hypothetical protein